MSHVGIQCYMRSYDFNSAANLIHRRSIHWVQKWIDLKRGVAAWRLHVFFQPKDFLSEALGAVPKTPLVFLMKPSSISHRCYLHFFFKVTNQQKSSIVWTIPSIQPEQRDQVGFECYHAVMGFVKTKFPVSSGSRHFKFRFNYFSVRSASQDAKRLVNK